MFVALFFAWVVLGFSGCATTGGPKEMVITEFENLSYDPKVQDILMKDRYYAKAVRLRNKPFGHLRYREEILNLLEKSCKTYHNPMAAKMGSGMLAIDPNLFADPNDKRKVALETLFAKELYDWHTCRGCLEWGDVVAKKDPHAALRIYREGIPLCKDDPTWVKSTLFGRYEYLRRKLEDEKSGVTKGKTP